MMMTILGGHSRPSLWARQLVALVICVLGLSAVLATEAAAQDQPSDPASSTITATGGVTTVALGDDAVIVGTNFGARVVPTEPNGGAQLLLGPVSGGADEYIVRAVEPWGDAIAVVQGSQLFVFDPDGQGGWIPRKVDLPGPLTDTRGDVLSDGGLGQAFTLGGDLAVWGDQLAVANEGTREVWIVERSGEAGFRFVETLAVDNPRSQIRFWDSISLAADDDTLAIAWRDIYETDRPTSFPTAGGVHVHQRQLDGSVTRTTLYSPGYPNGEARSNNGFGVRVAVVGDVVVVENAGQVNGNSSGRGRSLAAFVPRADGGFERVVVPTYGAPRSDGDQLLVWDSNVVTTYRIDGTAITQVGDLRPAAMRSPLSYDIDAERIVTVGEPASIPSLILAIYSGPGTPVATTLGQPTLPAGVAWRDTYCSAGRGVIGVEVTNNTATAQTYSVTIDAIDGSFSSTKSLTVQAGETGDVGVSGRGDGAYEATIDEPGAEPRRLAGWFSVAGAFATRGVTVHCGVAEAALMGVPCINEAGAAFVSITNRSDVTREYRSRAWYETQAIDDQADTDFGGLERRVILEPGQQTLLAFTGRNRDIGLFTETRAGDAGFFWATGEVVGEGAALIDCAGAPSEVGVLAGCLAFNGRIDVFINRTEATLYRVTITGPPNFTQQRTLDLTQTDTGRSTTTGRSDGTHQVIVERQGAAGWVPVDFFPSAVTVACDDPPTVTASTRTTCLNGKGRLDVSLANPGPGQADFVVDLRSGDLTPRVRSLNVNQRSRVIFTARPNGTFPVIVTQNGLVVLDETVTFSC